MSDPRAPASYSWEATNEEVARRYGLPLESVVRFDLNTSPAPPAQIARLLASSDLATGLSEYPPSDYRALVAAAADVYGVPEDELLVGAGADEIIDLVAKAFLSEGERSVIPSPAYAMYRVISEQRRAEIVIVPRLGPEDDWQIDRPAVRAAVRGGAILWLANPNNPTGRLEPDGLIEGLLGDLAVDAAADDRAAPVVVVDEAYSEFVGRSVDRASSRVSPADRDPDAQQGLCPGRPAGRIRDRRACDPGSNPAVSAARLGLDDVGRPGHRDPPNARGPGR